MPRRAARLLFRFAGWLLTPFVLICAAGIGATIGLVVAPRLSPNGGLAVTVALALCAAIAGLVGWVRLLRHSPELRHTFAVTEEGLPESKLVEHLTHPDDTNSDGSP